jgi:hypothetical protein
MMVDGWEAIDKTHIEGVLLKASQETFLLTAVPPGSEHHAIAVATIWENIIETHAKAHKPWLRYFCSDNVQGSVQEHGVYWHYDDPTSFGCFAGLTK